MRQAPVTRNELNRLHMAWESSPDSRSFAPLADAYHRAGRNEEAIELLHNGTARHPDYLSALVLLANCYQALGRTAEADAIFDRVLTQDAENLCALEHQAARSIQQGALGNAAALVQRLRQMDPWDATIQNLAVQLEQAPAMPAAETPAAPIDLPQDNWQQSRRGPIRSVEKSVYGTPPASPADLGGSHVSLPDGTRDELSTLTLAQIYESQGYLQKALTIYDQLAQQHPENEQIAQRLETLRRQLAGVDESAPAPAAAATMDRAPSPATPDWRLVDSQALESLEPPAEQAPTSQVWSPQDGAASGDAAPPLATPPGSAAAGQDEDFQRFLRYVRSLGR